MNTKFHQQEINVDYFELFIKKSNFSSRSLYLNTAYFRSKIVIDNCTFYNDLNGIILKLSNPEISRVVISNSQFVNSKVLTVSAGSFKEKFKNINIFFTNNTVINGNSIISYIDIAATGIKDNLLINSNDSFILIDNNNFVNLTGTGHRIDTNFFRYFGKLPIKIIGNSLRNISSCYKIIHMIYGQDVEISKNSILDSHTKAFIFDLSNNYELNRSHIKFHENNFEKISSSNFLSLKINKASAQFQSNKIYNSKFEKGWEIRISNGEETYVKIENNSFVNNTGFINLDIIGDFTPFIRENIFQNPGIRYELRTHILTPMAESGGRVLNGDRNFWNSVNPYRRIYGHKNNGNLIKTSISTYYEDEQKTKLVRYKNPDYIQHISNLSGYIEEEIEIKNNIDIVGETIFKKAVKIHPGVTITIKNCYYTVTFKDRLLINGTKKNPITFKLFWQNEFRLYRNFLEKYQDGHWRKVFFPLKLTYSTENAVICRHLCRNFDKGWLKLFYSLIVVKILHFFKIMSTINIILHLDRLVGDW